MSIHKYLQKTTPEMDALYRACASTVYAEALAARQEFTQALTMPLRQGVLRGDILQNIFEPMRFEYGQTPEFQLDFFGPSSENDFIAYVIPDTGAIPQKSISGDYVMVPTYEIGASIDWPVKYALNARWDVPARALQVLESAFVYKMNRDGWRTILAAAKGRNIVVYDDQAASGLFSKRLVSLGEISMRRNAGGNSTSLNRGQLTDLYMSPESHADVLSWDLTQAPDALRQQIYMNWSNSGIVRIGRVNLHDLDELGVNQEFQTYFTGTLGGAFPTDKVELLVGLDLTNRDAFVMPMRGDGVQIVDDPMFARQRRMGLWGNAELGFSCLNNRRTLLLAA
jgi:hypothetical protein